MAKKNEVLFYKMSFFVQDGDTITSKKGFYCGDFLGNDHKVATEMETIINPINKRDRMLRATKISQLKTKPKFECII